MEVRKSFIIKDFDLEERTFWGFAAAYNNVDRQGDLMKSGCFAKCLENEVLRNRVKVLWQHDNHQPIGVPVEMRDEPDGLWVKARISETTLGNDALRLMKDGVIDSLSVGFYLYEKDYTIDEKNVRIINEAVLKEFSLVTFSANDKAAIMGVKELSVREVEKVLREAGLSKTQAAAVALRGVPSLREVEEKGADETAFNAYLETIRDLKEVLK